MPPGKEGYAGNLAAELMAHVTLLVAQLSGRKRWANSNDNRQACELIIMLT